MNAGVSGSGAGVAAAAGTGVAGAGVAVAGAGVGEDDVQPEMTEKAMTAANKIAVILFMRYLLFIFIFTL